MTIRVAIVALCVALAVSGGWYAAHLSNEVGRLKAENAAQADQIHACAEQQKLIHVLQERRDAETIATQARRQRVAKDSAGLSADLLRWLREPGHLSANRAASQPPDGAGSADAGTEPRPVDPIAAVASACERAATDADIAIGERNAVIAYYQDMQRRFAGCVPAENRE